MYRIVLVEREKMIDGPQYVERSHERGGISVSTDPRDAKLFETVAEAERWCNGIRWCCPGDCFQIEEAV